ncbi:acyl carrier protein [Sinorhizobium alkalisoli]|uniref:acyl carrier protein n=1 Tax=Sinorhizobium alkalisoli TaxID=1752398 RepID=UPI000A66F055|nr:acyl carrier protein [Sinorhizobium alkalisoli]
MSEETGQPSSPAAVDGQDSHARDLIAIVTEFVRELHSQRASSIEIAPSSRIERDLGIDSLGRTELTLRIERAFQVRLPANAISEAETVSDLGGALERARPAGKRGVIRKSTASALPTVPAASEARTLVEALEWHEKRHRDRLHLTLLEDETTTLDTLSYGELAARAPGRRCHRPPWRRAG